MGGKKKKLKAGKNRGKGTQVIRSSDSRSPSPLCEQTVEEPPQSPRRTSRANSPSSCRASSKSRSPPAHPHKKAKTYTDLTFAQEDDMASWLELNELLYNKKVSAFLSFYIVLC